METNKNLNHAFLPSMFRGFFKSGKISWRNIWRNKRRSLLVLGSIIVGVMILILMDSINTGFVMQMLNNQIKQNVAHVQIHDKAYKDNPVIKNRISNPDAIEEKVKSYDFVKAYSKRVKIFGLISSAKNSAGVSIIGINPNEEKSISDMHKFITEGKYFKKHRNEIVIGKKLAEKLDVKLGDKIVAVASDDDSEVANELFRIVGIYQSSNSDFDKTHVYVKINTLQSMLKIDKDINEVAILTDDINKVDNYTDVLINDLNQNEKLEVRSYKKIIPIIVAYVDSYKQFIIVFYLIVGIAVIFGVVNSMLMSVFERIQEFGVLMSIGMPNGYIFGMVLKESFLIGVFGTLLGFIPALSLHYFWASNGLDLAMFSESLNSFGVGAVVYPVLSTEIVMNSMITMPIISIIGAIWPALKAIRLNPTEAIRYV